MDLLVPLVATKVIAILIGVTALMAGKKNDVVITPPAIRTISDTIFVSTELRNAFPKKLEEIILSGTPVTLRLAISAGNQRGEVTHCVKYDLSKKNFLIINPPDSSIAKDMDAAKRLMSRFNNMRIVHPGKEVTIILRATLDRAKIEALENKEFELMCFWDYQAPSLKFVAKK
jgi:hypothetical protein